MIYLTCDDQPDVIDYEVDLDGNITVEPAVDGAAGMFHLWMDVTDVAVGKHDVIIRARNMWGYSDATPPFSFTKVLPDIPVGITLQEV